jgi:hypothetical protein
MVRLAAAQAKQAGLARTVDPRAGDVAIVRFGEAFHGAIRTASGRWAIKAGDGMTITSKARALMAWRV